jgi:hypothetical protein
MSKNEDTFKLMDHSFALATASGSAAWEAFLRQKPILMFGYRLYQYAPGVYRINSPLDCIEAVEMIAKGENKSSRKDIVIYLKAMESFVFEGVIHPFFEPIATVSREQSIKNMVNEIIKWVNKDVKR